MKTKRLVGLIFAVTVAIPFSSPVSALDIPSPWGKKCSVYQNSKVVETVKHGKTYSFSDGNYKCDNGKWKIIQGSSSNSKKAIKLQNFSGENAIICRVLWSDGSVGQFNTSPRGQAVDVWQYFWGGGRWCVTLYENGGIRKLLC